MSFKRDGDDRSALENLRRRRVSDLLYEDIEEGEVSKLKNGRYVCKVCRHCPTFDTLNMFQVHKQGKRHKQSVEYQAIETQELQDLIQKRQHEQGGVYSPGTDPKLLGQAAANFNPKPEPYDPRSKRHKGKPYDRKATLDLQGLAKTPQRNDCEATSLNQLPGNMRSEYPQREKDCSLGRENSKVDQVEKGNQKFEGQNHPARKSNSSSNVSSSAKSNSLFKIFKPRHVDSDKDDEVIKSANVSKLVGIGQGDISKHYFARKQKLQIEKTPQEPVVRSVSRHDFLKSWEYFKDKPASKTAVPAKKTVEPKKDSVSGYQNDQQNDAAIAKAGAQQVSDEKGSNCEETKERAEKMLKAFGSGWKKDWAGNWVKDEDAEFDTDEEPPEIT